MATVKPVGPGPGAYVLPPTVGYPCHDPSRDRAPMYSFGARTGHGGGCTGPGPIYRIERVTREGPETPPAWSLGGRLAGRRAACTPGPGAHAPESCPPMKEQRAPAFSLGPRICYEPRRAGPAPNAYLLGSTAEGPCFSLGARPVTCEKSMSPGPAVYYQRTMDVYMPRLPVYTLGPRTERGAGCSRSPGPAAYPPNLYNTKKNGLMYSFGTKHCPYAPPMVIKEDEMPCLP